VVIEDLAFASHTLNVGVCLDGEGRSRPRTLEPSEARICSSRRWPIRYTKSKTTCSSGWVIGSIPQRSVNEIDWNEQAAWPEAAEVVVRSAA